jgi:hypothetical protein
MVSKSETGRLETLEKDEEIQRPEEKILEQEVLIDQKRGERCGKGEIEKRTENLIRNVRAEFNRINTITRSGVVMEDNIIDGVLWLTFRRDKMSKSLQIPLPIITESGIELLKNNDVLRVLCNFWLEREQKKINYHEVMENLLTEDVNVIFPLQESGSPLLHKIVKAFDRNWVAFMVSATQRIINDVVNVMPLHETDMNSWAMNHRLMIIDPEFSFLSDPNERLEYQVEKNRKYYEKFGWTAIGLSDGVLADKNYLLTVDLRKHTPFGRHHNPQRNLYSTLCMKGDELPKIRTKSMQTLIERGITRKGWNLVTAILDTPLNFEDQILVDRRLMGKSHTVTKRFTIYGTRSIVKRGEKLKFGDVLGFSEDGEPVIMDIKCDEAVVRKFRKQVVELNGDQVNTIVIVVEGKRFLRDGTKFSNLHGNKGIVKVLDLGHAIDPRTGEEIPIDVMISAKSINKRKNFGQVVEALANNVVEGEDPIVVEDDLVVEKLEIESALERKGLPKDGTWMISTYCGEFQAIVGKMFWGITKDPEDQLWEGERTELTNNRELRTSGLKFSHVELRALVTRFGPGNPLLKEIISYSQGVEALQDEIRILHSARGEVDPTLPIIDAVNVNYVNMDSGIFHTIDEIKGTVVDDEYMPKGFVLRLPCYFQAIVNKRNPELFTMGLPQEIPENPPEEPDEYMFNTVFIPNSLLRRCWRHPSGKWGLNTIGLYVNNIIMQCHKFLETGDVNAEADLMRAVARYFINVAKMMGTKRGELSTYGMAVRYPYSSRATAALSEELPRNTVEIHRDMADKLKVKTGDVLLAERFPCLGFMSIRPQYVQVSDDPQCKYVIRVSGNSLVSMNLDFDGDTLFLASFHRPESKELLQKEMREPNEFCENAVEQMNAKKVPEYREMALNDLEMCDFPTPTNEEHAELVRKATGVKSHTGPVIALAYNLMRIVERNIPYSRIEDHANIELLLDFVGNSVFSQKHGIKSLQEEVTDAICMADVAKMVELGFDPGPSKLLCDLIIKEAASLNIRDLVAFHEKTKAQGGSKIINLIVRRKNKIYFATRASLGPYSLLNHLEADAVDLPSFMLQETLRSEKEEIEEKLERLKARRMKVRNQLRTERMKDVYGRLADLVDQLTTKKKSKEVFNGLE